MGNVTRMRASTWRVRASLNLQAFATNHRQSEVIQNIWIAESQPNLMDPNTLHCLWLSDLSTPISLVMKLEVRGHQLSTAGLMTQP